MATNTFLYLYTRMHGSEQLGLFVRICHNSPLLRRYESAWAPWRTGIWAKTHDPIVLNQAERWSYTDPQAKPLEEESLSALTIAHTRGNHSRDRMQGMVKMLLNCCEIL